MVNDKWLMPCGHKYPHRHCERCFAPRNDVDNKANRN
jgi:hypothetical protein